MPERKPYPVLIVDDDPMALALLEKHLTAAGHEVWAASNGAEAMRTLLIKGIPVIITDWMMPEMDGLELCRAIRAHEGIRYAYVIIVTAHTDRDRVVEAFEAGADDYLSKPLNRRELLARLQAGERIIGLQRDLDSRNLEVHRSNAEMAIANIRLAEANQKLDLMATHDELTGLINRREAMHRLEEWWAASERHEDPLACITLDLDHFKSCNDVYGHAVGDVVLKATAEVLRSAVRTDECIARIGGEEFLAICPRSTEAMAATAAERLRKVVEANVVKSDNLEVRVTISLGVAQRMPEMKRPDDLLRAADAALYAAKDKGRNRVCLASTHKEEAFVEQETIALLADPKPSPFAAEGGDSPGRILVVDDDGATRALCRKLLEREGYQVIEADDGVEALERVRLDGPEVIVMDSQMPDMDGLECTRHLKEDPDTKGIPVIMASARTDATDVVAGLASGADEYLTKPLDPREFLLRVGSMHRLYRHQLELLKGNEVRGELSRAMTLLSDLSGQLAAAETLERVLEEATATAAELTCCRCVSILLPDADGRFLTVGHSIGIDPALASGIHVGVGEATAGRVFQTAGVVVVNTAEEASPERGECDSQLFFGHPRLSQALVASEQVVGVLNVSDRQSGLPFKPLDQECIALVANVTASAVEEFLTRRARDQARDSIVIALAKLAECRDTDTGKHVDRVTRFSVLLGQELQSHKRHRAVITDRFLSDLERAVPLHDIGKVSVPDHILLKPGPLTEEETALMRTHAAKGAATIRSVLQHGPDATFLVMAEEIALGHHEWYNGEGYPQGHHGDAIPPSARIVAVADVYDALTTQRVYKDAIPHDRAIEIISESAGVQFDPDVTAALEARESDFARLAIELADSPPPRSVRSTKALLA